MDVRATQPAAAKMRWACPLGCEGGFINIPQTNEHLKKSHVTPKKGREQGSISTQEMEEVREFTKKNRLKTDRFKMQMIHHIFNKHVHQDDLELHAATRDEIKRTSTACAQGRPGTEPVMQTFKRLAVGRLPGFDQYSSENQDSMMHSACLLIPHFLSALAITGVLISDDNGVGSSGGGGGGGGGGQEGLLEAERTSMHHPPPTAGDAPGSSAVTHQERAGLNTLSSQQVSYNVNFDGSTVVGSAIDQDYWPKEWLNPPSDGGREWAPAYSSAGYAAAQYSQHGNPAHMFGQQTGMRNSMDGDQSMMGFDQETANGIWDPPLPAEGYKGARDIWDDLVPDDRLGV